MALDDLIIFFKKLPLLVCQKVILTVSALLHDFCPFVQRLFLVSIHYEDLLL